MVVVDVNLAYLTGLTALELDSNDWRFAVGGRSQLPSSLQSLTIGGGCCDGAMAARQHGVSNAHNCIEY